MESLPITNFEESQRSRHLNAPMAAESQQLQPSDSDPKTMDALDLPASKGKLKVSRDEEPPSIYPRPTSATPPRRPGVLKRSHVEPEHNARVPRDKLHTDSEPPFELPPSLVSQYPDLRPAQQQQMSGTYCTMYQPQQMPGTYRTMPPPQQMSGTYRTMYQPQQRSGNHRSFEGTSSANGRRAEDRSYDFVPQMQAFYQPQIDDLYGQKTVTLQQEGTYPTYDAKHFMNNIKTNRIPQERYYNVPDKPQYMQPQFSAQMQPPYEQSKAEQSGASELSLHQRQTDTGRGVPVPRLPSYESPYILTPQIECSFAAPDESDALEDFDFDAYLKEEAAKNDGFDFSALSKK